MNFQDGAQLIYTWIGFSVLGMEHGKLLFFPMPIGKAYLAHLLFWRNTCHLIGRLRDHELEDTVCYCANSRLPPALECTPLLVIIHSISYFPVLRYEPDCKKLAFFFFYAGVAICVRFQSI